MSSTVSNLRVWQHAMDLAYDVYESTRSFPRQEIYGMASQMRRAAVSIPSNIAEGKGRSSPKELVQFLFTARGSLLELETQTLLAARLGYLEAEQTEHLKRAIEIIGKELNSLINTVKAA